jgi:hypothetical protein
VPVVVRALDVLVLLQRSKSPLRTNEISDMKQMLRSTTFRILRTLAQRGYISQNLQHQFSARHTHNVDTLPIKTDDAPAPQPAVPHEPNDHELANHETNLSAGEVVEIQYVVLRNYKCSMPILLSVKKEAEEVKTFCQERRQG